MLRLDETRRQHGLLWYGVHVLAYAGLAFSLLFNIWSVEKLLTHDGQIEWPHTLHVWLIQFTALTVSVIGLVVVAWRAELQRWLLGKTPAQQAAVLFWTLVTFQSLLGVAFLVTKNHPGFSDWGYLYDLFNVNQEFSIPTLYNVGLLVLASALALLAAYRTRRYQTGQQAAVLTWSMTALVLGIMSLDELLSFHEQAGALLGEATRSSVSNYGHTWTFVALPIVAVLGLYFLVQFRRIFAQAPGQLALLLLAGAIFVIGAVFVENLQRYLQVHHGLPDALTVYHLIEEMAEMLGVTLAIRVFYRRARELLPTAQSGQNRQ